MHDTFISFALGRTASSLLAVLSGLLAVSYTIQFFIIPHGSKINTEVRKNRLFLRAFNWAIFSFIFLLFGEVIELRDLATWRATARVALFFLMLPEMAYQITILWPYAKEAVWTKD